MNKYFIYAIIFIAIILVIGAFTYGSRMLNNAATPITVKEVENGVKCASMVTKDGAALSCWKM